MDWKLIFGILMSIKISDMELDILLTDSKSEWVKFYIGLRKHMDYKTGIAGKPRRLSERYFIELMEERASQGKAAVRFDRNKVHRTLKTLEEIGLIKPLGNMVFLCILADWDESVSRKSERKPNIGDPTSANKENTENPEEKLKKQEKSERKCEQKYPPRCEPPPVSGYIPLDTNIEINNLKPLEALSNSQKSRIATSSLEVLNYLRKKTGKNFGKDENHLAEIKARLKDKPAPSIDDCKMVIDFMWDKWCESDEMRDNANPTTLFRKKNFYRYLDAAKEGSGNSEASLQARLERVQKEEAEREEAFQRAQDEYHARLRG